MQRNETSVFIRHMHFIDFLQHGLSETFLYMNLIREPLARFVSYFYYYKEPDKMHLIKLPKEAANVSLNECVETNFKKCIQPEFIFKMIPFLCGYDSQCYVPSKWALYQAMKNVEKYFPVVGYLENYDQFLELLEYVWPQFFDGARDVYKDMMEKRSAFYKHATVKEEKLSPEHTEIMKARLSLEYDLYYFIKQRFHCIFKNICRNKS